MLCLPCLELLGAQRVGDVLPTLFGTPWYTESGRCSAYLVWNSLVHREWVMFCLPCLELLGAQRVGDVLPTLFGTPWCTESG